MFAGKLAGKDNISLFLGFGNIYFYFCRTWAKIRVYSAAKTVADCFKMRNKIGLDVALEALREALRTKKASSEEIHKMARICRVDRIIRPYMEMAVFSYP